MLLNIGLSSTATRTAERRGSLAAFAALAVLAAACGSSGEPRAAVPSSAVSTATTAPFPAATTATTATTAPIDPGAPCAGRPAPASFEHVVWIWMENHTYGQVIGSSSAPYETGLAHACATATSYATVGSPSLPNYIGATSGSTQGIADDNSPASHALTVDNLFRQVRASGRRARSYEEAMPANCALESSGNYAVKHNPQAYYQGGSDRAACNADDIPLGTASGGALAADLDANTLPAFSFVTPDLCHDTHDCSVADGDAWLREWVPKVLSSASYASGTTAVFLAWDEPTPMPNILIAPSVHAGTTISTRVDHYALLRTTEELLGIGSFLGQAAAAPSFRSALGA